MTLPELLAQLPSQGSAGGSGSGGCCSGTAPPAFAGGKVPVDIIGLPTIQDGVQEIPVTLSARGYSPAALVLQKGMKAAITFKVDALTSCNNPVSFPEYNGLIDLTQEKPGRQSSR